MGLFDKLMVEVRTAVGVDAIRRPVARCGKEESDKTDDVDDDNDDAEDEVADDNVVSWSSSSIRNATAFVRSFSFSFSVETAVASASVAVAVTARSSTKTLKGVAAGAVLLEDEIAAAGAVIADSEDAMGSSLSSSSSSSFCSTTAADGSTLRAGPNALPKRLAKPSVRICFLLVADGGAPPLACIIDVANCEVKETCLSGLSVLPPSKLVAWLLSRSAINGALRALLEVLLAPAALSFERLLRNGVFSRKDDVTTTGSLFSLLFMPSTGASDEFYNRRRACEGRDNSRTSFGGNPCAGYAKEIPT